MTTENGRAFNEWLRAQLKAKKMSQRQLAQQSGVDHSTISRLIRGDRMPSLGTATKLARGLREIRDDSDTSTALGRGVRGAAEPDRARRVRASGRRGALGAAGPADHGVLPGSSGAPVRADLLQRRFPRAGIERERLPELRAPSTAGRTASPASPRPRGPRPSRRATASSGRPRGHRPARRVDHRTSPGHDLNVPPRSGLGDSERRSAGAGVRIFPGSRCAVAAAAPLARPPSHVWPSPYSRTRFSEASIGLAGASRNDELPPKLTGICVTTSKSSVWCSRRRGIAVR